MTKDEEREAEIRAFIKEHGDFGWFEGSDVIFLLAEIDRLRAALKRVESHLAAIAESPCSMDYRDIEQLGLAREVIDEALEQK